MFKKILFLVFFISTQVAFAAGPSPRAHKWSTCVLLFEFSAKDRTLNIRGDLLTMQQSVTSARIHFALFGKDAAGLVDQLKPLYAASTGSERIVAPTQYGTMQSGGLTTFANGANYYQEDLIFYKGDPLRPVSSFDGGMSHVEEGNPYGFHLRRTQIVSSLVKNGGRDIENNPKIFLEGRAIKYDDRLVSNYLSKSGFILSLDRGYSLDDIQHFPGKLQLSGQTAKDFINSFVVHETRFLGTGIMAYSRPQSSFVLIEDNSGKQRWELISVNRKIRLIALHNSNEMNPPFTDIVTIEY
jgi:hypothetical protein